MMFRRFNLIQKSFPRFSITRTLAQRIQPIDPKVKQKMLSLLESSKKNQPVKEPLVWVDCEMTGLDINNDKIIEICCLITDGDLNVVDEDGYESTIYYDSTVMDNMNEWCIEQHGKTGLTEKVLSNPQQTLDKVRSELLTYIKQYIPDNRVGVMAGNSIHMDKFFMYREFPEVIDHLHYRLLDVSAIMEMGFRHNRDLMKVAPPKAGNHTARSDILDSINQLKWYREHYLKSPAETRTFVLEEQIKKDARKAEREERKKQEEEEKEEDKKEE